MAAKKKKQRKGSVPAPKLSRDQRNRQAFREVAEALGKVLHSGDRDRILDAVQCLLGDR